jgi:2-dehydro-3-deoxyphosphogluconate aldolase/(4S)-4-hydroxy-2-oxoglutarate aldolase
VEKEIPIIPGCMTPGEIEQALDFGLEVVKFFPAEAAGGLGMIKALKAPYKNLKFMPTGGITIEKAAQYLREESVLACGGSWMVKADLIQKGDFEQIARLTKEAAALVKKIKNGD